MIQSHIRIHTYVNARAGNGAARSAAGNSSGIPRGAAASMLFKPLLKIRTITPKKKEQTFCQVNTIVYVNAVSSPGSTHIYTYIYIYIHYDNRLARFADVLHHEFFIAVLTR